MATLQRFSRQSCVQIARLLRNQGSTYTVRCVSTTKKDRDITKVDLDTTIEKSREMEVLEKHFADADPDKLKNWISQGWHMTDRDTDRFMANLYRFVLFSLVTVGLHFVFFYLPDFRLRDWAAREAYLDIERRRKAGLPLVDPYYVPPEQVVLPTEEELKDQEIVI